MSLVVICSILVRAGSDGKLTKTFLVEWEGLEPLTMFLQQSVPSEILIS